MAGGGSGGAAPSPVSSAASDTTRGTSAVQTRVQTRGHVPRHADTCPDNVSSAVVGEYSDELNTTVKESPVVITVY